MSTQIPAQPEFPSEPYPEIDPEIASQSLPGFILPPETPRTPRQPHRPRAPKTISLSHHAPRCSICNHPEREAIEQAFLHWERPSMIAYEYNLGHRRAVYRHAHALGLFQQRVARVRHSLGFIIEQAQTVKATADSVIRAVKACACLSEDGRWTEPEKRIVIIHQVASPEAAPRRAIVPVARVAPGVEIDAAAPADLTRIGIPSEASRREGPRTSHSPLATSSKIGRASSAPIDGYACLTKNATTPSPSTKVGKLMDTLLHPFRMRISPGAEGRRTA